MGRNDKQAQAPANTQPAVDINALREEQKRIQQQIAALKANAEGKVESIAFAEDDATLLQLDIRVPVACERKTGDGRPYLFALDGFTFVDAKGREWQVSAIYATAKKPKAQS